ncbi:hypothetical protein CVT24_005838 [Panaeolus cyanescens]|uniref:Uncharacterized protein n=1 Tax=Panaeolus cyanescens TaxID=181874 RepID=A0A409VE96_9AGAR|nr:hypothetical protein CVT24_005838 [Panaeolus cyanescens]
MQLKLVLLALAQAVAILAQGPVVLTAEQIFATVVDYEPFLIEVTTTTTWTQSPSISEPEPTVPPTPTIFYG